MNNKNRIKNRMLKQMLIQAFPKEFKDATDEFGTAALRIEKREDGIWAKTLVILDDLGKFPLHEKESYTWFLGKKYPSAARKIIKAAQEQVALYTFQYAKLSSRKSLITKS